jgi:hypothetical protein
MPAKFEYSFEAVDAAGNLHTLSVYRNYIPQGNQLSPNTPDVPGSWEIKTQDEKHVNCNSKGVYEIVRNANRNIRLTSTDPKAPECGDNG